MACFQRRTKPVGANRETPGPTTNSVDPYRRVFIFASNVSFNTALDSTSSNRQRCAVCVVSDIFSLPVSGFDQDETRGATESN
jgi:hypothetical protein